MERKLLDLSAVAMQSDGRLELGSDELRALAHDLEVLSAGGCCLNPNEDLSCSASREYNNGCNNGSAYNPDCGNTGCGGGLANGVCGNADCGTTHDGGCNTNVTC